MSYRRHLVAAVLAAGFCGMFGGIGPAVAQDVCDILYYERNTIYKRYRYCFRSERSRATFGNEGCVYTRESQIPFTRAERYRILYIIEQERASGCRD